MRKIEEKDKWDSLDPLEFEQVSDHAEELLEASNLLYEVINASWKCSRDCLSIEVNGQSQSLRNLYWDCKQDMEAAEKGGIKTEFLKMSILEKTFQHALPLLLVRVENLVNGDNRQVEAVKRLQEIFSDNLYKKMWMEKAEQYRDMLSHMGFTVASSDYQDLTAIMDPLLNAFTLYEGGYNKGGPSILQIRSGIRSEKEPIIMREVCKYSSEKDFVDAIEGCGKECVIAFGAIEKTNRQIKDYFYEWKKGYPEERQRNYMYHDNLTTEEYLEQVAEYTRAVWFCVKCGQVIYLMRMPHHVDTYANLTNPDSLYYYGKRAGYAPYAIFYKDMAPAEKDTSFLAIPRKGYPLSELMDDQQKVWLPVFLNETIERFFHTEPEAKAIILAEETCVSIKDGNGASTEIVPAGNLFPAVHTWIYEAKGPDEVFQNETYIQTLIKYFEITSNDLRDVPLCPRENKTEEKMRAEVEGNIQAAYLKILGEHVEDYVSQANTVRKTIVEQILFNKGYENDIIEEALKGSYISFTETVIDGTHVLDKDGNPIMITNPKAASWNAEPKQIPEIRKTSTDDCKAYRMEYLCRTVRPKIYWVGEPTSAKPPVVLKIRPRIKADYETFFRSLGIGMPEYFNLIDEITTFRKEYGLYRKGNFEHCDVLANINVCMRKSVYKKFKTLKEGEKK